MKLSELITCHSKRATQALFIASAKRIGSISNNFEISKKICCSCVFVYNITFLLLFIECVNEAVRVHIKGRREYFLSFVTCRK